jgi:hypothetical protein
MFVCFLKTHSGLCNREKEETDIFEHKKRRKRQLLKENIFLEI